MNRSRLNTEDVSPSAASDIADVELVARAAHRDRAAFEQLYDRYSGKAFGLALRILGDRGISEEVTQEAFWRAWQNAKVYDSTRASFSSWLLTIVHHCAIDELRKQRSRTAINDIEASETEAQAIPDPRADTPEHAWANLQSEQVKAALAKLPDTQRSVIEMAYFGGFTRQEIAQRLNEPVGTIHTRARLGLLKLKELLVHLKM